MNTMNCAPKKYIGLKRTKGITLIELIITMAMVAILIGYGLPRLTGTSQNSRLTTAINTLSGDFAYARSEAVTRAVTVRVVSNAGNDWSTGWIVETVPAVGLPVTIRTAPALTTNLLLTGDAGNLTYNSDGTQTAGLLTFTACKSGDVTPHGRELRVIATGRVKLVTGAGCP